MQTDRDQRREASRWNQRQQPAEANPDQQRHEEQRLLMENDDE